MSLGFEVRRVRAAATRPMRQQVLRPHQRAEELVYSGDEDAHAGHFAAFVEGALAGVASICPEGRSNVGVSEGVWRIRGMAVRPDCRGRGLGAALLEACLDHARTHGGSVAWCNARIGARRFYERHGFAVDGDAFEIPDIGVHFVMERGL